MNEKKLITIGVGNHLHNDPNYTNKLQLILNQY